MSCLYRIEIELYIFYSSFIGILAETEEHKIKKNSFICISYIETQKK